MTGNAAEIAPTFERAVRDFMDEEFRREPFSTINLVEGQLSSLLGRVESAEKKLVRGSVLWFPVLCDVYSSPSRMRQLVRLSNLKPYSRTSQVRAQMWCHLMLSQVGRSYCVPHFFRSNLMNVSQVVAQTLPKSHYTPTTQR